MIWTIAPLRSRRRGFFSWQMKNRLSCSQKKAVFLCHTSSGWSSVWKAIWWNSGRNWTVIRIKTGNTKAASIRNAAVCRSVFSQNCQLYEWEYSTKRWIKQGISQKFRQHLKENFVEMPIEDMKYTPNARSRDGFNAFAPSKSPSFRAIFFR